MDMWEFDAAEHDPLTKLRIPVVGSFNPRWRYIGAYLATNEGAEVLDSPPFSSSERPTDGEAAMIASYIQEYIQHWFNESYQAKLRERVLDVDSGANTTIFIKYGEDDWGYRRASWRYGHTFVPPPPMFREKYPEESCGGPLSLPRVMDRIHTIGDEPMKHWTDWKSSHPDIFK